MKYIEFYNQFQNFPLISLIEIRKIEPNFDLRRLSEWQQKGYLKKLCSGYYIFSNKQISDQLLFTIANKMHTPSYVSLESAFSWHGLIPEAVYMITSVSSKKTKTIKTPLGNFSYRSLKPELLFGYELQSGPGGGYSSGGYDNFSYKIANMEKSLLDYFYLNTDFKPQETIESLRLNTVLLKEKLQFNIVRTYLRIFNNKRLSSKIELFLEKL